MQWRLEFIVRIMADVVSFIDKAETYRKQMSKTKKTDTKLDFDSFLTKGVAMIGDELNTTINIDFLKGVPHVLLRAQKNAKTAVNSLWSRLF